MVYRSLAPTIYGYKLSQTNLEIVVQFIIAKNCRIEEERLFGLEDLVRDNHVYCLLNIAS